jgi:hypothetical protein
MKNKEILLLFSFLGTEKIGKPQKKSDIFIPKNKHSS